tara:strand:+ start:211 stop:504 length:294 start_codon:yes stop_codon:yes gene_type:complete
MNFYELCGYVSGFLFAISLVPQVYKSCKTKLLRDLSLIHQSIFLFGMILNLIYSIHEDLKPVYIPASCEAFFMFLLFIMKIYYRKNELIDDKDIENP